MRGVPTFSFLKCFHFRSHWNLLILCHFGESLQSETQRPCMLLLDSLQGADPGRYEKYIRKYGVLWQVVYRIWFFYFLCYSSLIRCLMWVFHRFQICTGHFYGRGKTWEERSYLPNSFVGAWGDLNSLFVNFNVHIKKPLPKKEKNFRCHNREMMSSVVTLFYTTLTCSWKVLPRISALRATPTL